MKKNVAISDTGSESEMMNVLQRVAEEEEDDQDREHAAEQRVELALR